MFRFLLGVFVGIVIVVCLNAFGAGDILDDVSGFIREILGVGGDASGRAKGVGQELLKTGKEAVEVMNDVGEEVMDAGKDIGKRAKKTGKEALKRGTKAAKKATDKVEKLTE